MSPRAGIVAVAIAVVGMGSAVLPSSARAEDETPAEPAPATAPETAPSGDADIDGDAFVRRGLELRLQRRDREALLELQKAYAARPSPRVLAHVALCEQAVGAWRAADQHLHAAVTAEDDPWIQRHRYVLEQALAVIGTHVAELDSAAPAAAGSAREARPADVVTPAGPDRARPFRIAGAAAAVAGVVLVSAGLVASIDVGTASHANQVGDVFSPDREQGGKRAETLQWVFYGAGAAALGAGLALALYARQLPPRGSGVDPSAPNAAGLAPQLAPFVTATGGGLSLTVRR